MSPQPPPDDPEVAAVPSAPRGADGTVETPWGPSQLVLEIAPGIVRYDTATHGGYYVSPERVAAMPKPLREFRPFAGPNWYEEDCDWSVVVAAFPQFFPPDAVAAALVTLERYQPELHAVALTTRAGARGA